MKRAGVFFHQALKIAGSSVAGTLGMIAFIFAAAGLQSVLVTPSGNFVHRAVSFLSIVVYVTCFYGTFRLLEPGARTRKKLFVAGAALVLAWSVKPAIRWSLTSPPPDLMSSYEGLWLPGRSTAPPKPYDVAVYDVYSDLLQTPQPWLEHLMDPRPEAVLIRRETERGNFNQGTEIARRIVPDERFQHDVDSAIGDYLKRNINRLELQRRFSLPTYDLITEAEEGAVLQEQLPNRGDSACQLFRRKYPGYVRWVELSAVGFNENQTVAVLYMVEWRGSQPLCGRGIFGHGGYRMLRRQGGKWNLIKNQVISDWLS